MSRNILKTPGFAIALNYPRLYNNCVWKNPNKSSEYSDVVGDLPVILMELDSQDYMAIEKTYIYANGQILCQHDGNDTDPRYFYMHDRLGSVRQVFSSSGDVKDYYTYEPFGEVFGTENTENISNPFKFTGQYYDSETGEYYLRARQYNPRTYRFTSRDPVAGKFEEPLTLHRYLYCISDPINRVDPFGRDYIDINFTWTYGMVPGMLQGGILGSEFGPVGTGVGAGVGAVLGTSGFTGGVMFESNKAHFYLGPSWTTNIPGGVDYTMSVCPSSDTTVETGWHYAISASASGAYTQWGKNLTSGNTFQEFGMTSGTSMGSNVGASVFYVFPEMGIPTLSGGDPRSAFSELSLLDKAIMLNSMREDTGKLMRTLISGKKESLSKRIEANMGAIWFISTYGVTSDMLLSM